MITDLQNGRSLFLLNRHNIFKLLSKKILVQYFLLKMTLKPEFNTGRQILTIFPRCSQVEIQFSYLTVVLLK